MKAKYKILSPELTFYMYVKSSPDNWNEVVKDILHKMKHLGYTYIGSKRELLNCPDIYSNGDFGAPLEFKFTRHKITGFHNIPDSI